MKWLVLSYLISLGSMNYHQFTPATMYVATPDNTFQTTLGVEAQLIDNHIFLGGTVETWETSLNDGYFSPWESLYVFNAGIRWGGLEIGYKHECDHPTFSSSSLPGFCVVSDEIYITYKAKLSVF
jgi:hypothetical protein